MDLNSPPKDHMGVVELDNQLNWCWVSLTMPVSSPTYHAVQQSAGSEDVE